MQVHHYLHLRFRDGHEDVGRPPPALTRLSLWQSIRGSLPRQGEPARVECRRVVTEHAEYAVYSLLARLQIPNPGTVGTQWAIYQHSFCVPTQMRSDQALGATFREAARLAYGPWPRVETTLLTAYPLLALLERDRGPRLLRRILEAPTSGEAFIQSAARAVVAQHEGALEEARLSRLDFEDFLAPMPLGIWPGWSIGIHANPRQFPQPVHARGLEVPTGVQQPRGEPARVPSLRELLDEKPPGRSSVEGDAGIRVDVQPDDRGAEVPTSGTDTRSLDDAPSPSAIESSAGVEAPPPQAEELLTPDLVSPEPEPEPAAPPPPPPPPPPEGEHQVPPIGERDVDDGPAACLPAVREPSSGPGQASALEETTAPAPEAPVVEDAPRFGPWAELPLSGPPGGAAGSPPSPTPDGTEHAPAPAPDRVEEPPSRAAVPPPPTLPFPPFARGPAPVAAADPIEQPPTSALEEARPGQGGGAAAVDVSDPGSAGRDDESGKDWSGQEFDIDRDVGGLEPEPVAEGSPGGGRGKQEHGEPTNQIVEPPRASQTATDVLGPLLRIVAVLGAAFVLLTTLALAVVGAKVVVWDGLSAERDHSLGKDGEPPAADKDGEPPAAGKDGEPPAAGKDGEPPAAGKDGEPPAAGKDGEPPAAGKDGEPPEDTDPHPPPPTDKGGKTEVPKKVCHLDEDRDGLGGERSEKAARCKEGWTEKSGDCNDEVAEWKESCPKLNFNPVKQTDAGLVVTLLPQGPDCASMQLRWRCDGGKENQKELGRKKKTDVYFGECSGDDTVAKSGGVEFHAWCCAVSGKCFEAGSVPYQIQ